MATTNVEKPSGKRGRPRRADGLEPSAARYTVPAPLMPLILKLTNGANRDAVITQLLTEALSARLSISPKQNDQLPEAIPAFTTQHGVDSVADRLTAKLERFMAALTDILSAAAQQQMAAAAHYLDDQTRLCREREQKFISLIDHLSAALSPFINGSEHSPGAAAVTLERVADSQLVMLETLKILNEDVSTVRSILDGDRS